MQKVRPYMNIADSFKKIVVVRDHIIPRHDERGALYIGIERFLLKPNSPEL